MTNKNNTVLYTGVTSDLNKRVYEHKTGKDPKSFTYRYKTDKLAYYKEFQFIEDAIDFEKKIKAGSRKKKIELIHEFNPTWKDLYPISE